MSSFSFSTSGKEEFLKGGFVYPGSPFDLRLTMFKTLTQLFSKKCEQNSLRGEHFGLVHLCNYKQFWKDPSRCFAQG